MDKIILLGLSFEIGIKICILRMIKKYIYLFGILEIG